MPSSPVEKTRGLRRPHTLTLVALLICLIHFFALVYFARRHPYGTYATETDFYQLYAPDAERMAAGQFPLNTYQGPGYSFMITWVAKMTGLSDDLFTAGKWSSVVCAVLCGWLVFLLFSALFDPRVGLGAQLIAVASGELPQYSIQAATDIFFLLLCLAALVSFLGPRIPLIGRAALAGVLTGAAYLTRYNGLFLLATCLLGILLVNLFELPWARRFSLSAIYLFFFLLIASPWLYGNWVHHGSPLYNTNYLNLATEFYPELVGGEVNQDATRALDAKFRSFGDVLRYDTKRILSHYPQNLWESLRRSLSETLVFPWVAGMAWLGLLLALRRRSSKGVLVLALSGLLYFLLMGLNHWETRYYFFITVLYAGFASFAAYEWLAMARRQGWFANRFSELIPAGVIVLMLLLTLSQSRGLMTEFLDSQPSELIAARDYLRSVNARGVRIVARKPHLPYMTRNEWVFFPQVNTLDEFRAWIEAHPVDYIAISRRELKERKRLSALGDPKKAPAWLTPVWVNTDPLFILYQPKEMVDSGR
jgi:hypothetical protein